MGPQGPPPPTVLFTPMTSACNANVTWPTPGQAPVPLSTLASPLPGGVGMVAALRPAPHSTPTPQQAIADPIVQKVAWQKGAGDVVALGEAREAWAKAQAGESAWALGSTSSAPRTALEAGGTGGGHTSSSTSSSHVGRLVVGAVLAGLLLWLLLGRRGGGGGY